MNQTAALQSEPLWRELAGTDAFAVALQLAEEPGFLFLDSAMRNERLLNRVQSFAVCQAFHGDDICAMSPPGRDEAGHHGLSV